MSVSRTVLITGATGTVSTALMHALDGADVDLRALIHEESRADGPHEQGAEVFVGDLDDARSLPPAFEGVQDVWLLTPNGPRASEHSMNAVWAARLPSLDKKQRHSTGLTELERGHQMMRSVRRLGAVLAALTLAVTVGGSAGAASDPRAGTSPTSISLPDGFRPEGIAIGPGPFAFIGSMADGSIYRADLRTGRGAIVSRGPGTPSLGMKTDPRGRLFVAGGTGGDARVIDSRTGRVLASYRLTTGAAFVNDVILTQGAAWFTDSTNPVLYKLPLRGGRLPAAAQRIPLTGDLVYGAGFNANGITPTPDGQGLIIVQSNTGGLFRVDLSGRTRRVNLHGESLPDGDGLLLRGRTLFAVENGVQNGRSAVTVLRLNATGTDGRVVRRVSDPRFDIPATVAAFGPRLYLPNARFTTKQTPRTPYIAVAIPRP
ncbi:NmrA family NAD(P)-binding protein [Nonomuraea mangrovi]|uniref:NmrA family NAD(P)-binding protein n=1 Tax=Nonomuraea mangrovi TaxID=2316207 RepID=A0ABW4T3D5_9ACTN